MESFNVGFNHYVTNLSTGLESLLATSNFSDVILKVEDKSFKVHKFMLAMFSPYFQELFMMNPCKHTIVCIENVQHDVMRELLRFMYEGKAEINAEDFDKFVETANELQIKGIESMTSLEEITISESMLIDCDKEVHESSKEVNASVDLLSADSIKIEDVYDDCGEVLIKDEVIEVDVGPTVIEFNAESADNDHIEIEYCSEVDDDDDDYDPNCDVCSDSEDDVEYGKLALLNNAAKTLALDSLKSYPEDGGETVAVSFLKLHPQANVTGILVNDVRYSLKRNCKMWSRWTCSGRMKCKCSAGILLTKDKRIVFTYEHNHDKRCVVKFASKKDKDIIDRQETYTILSFETWRCVAKGSIAQSSAVVRTASDARLPQTHSHAKRLKIEPDKFLPTSAAFKRDDVKEINFDDDEDLECPAQSLYHDGEEVAVQFVKARRDQKLLGILVDDIRYSVERTCKMWSRWTCTARALHKCKAGVILTNDHRIIFTHRHNHAKCRLRNAIVDYQRMYTNCSLQTWHNVKDSYFNESKLK